MAKWTTCLFDLDGTLIDTIDDLAAATEQVLTEFGFGNADGSPLYTKADYHQFVGGGVKRLLHMALGKHSTPEILDKALPRFLEIYNENCKVKTAPYEGIMDLLDELKARGIKLGVVTNKPEKQARYLAEAFFGDYGLYCVYGSVADRPNKPDPASVQLALADCNSAAETTLFIGDSDVDIQTALAAGMPCISVAWGLRDEDFLRQSGATRLVHTAEELLACLFSDEG